eukprot:m.212030 g.212030  ORF g.212030 m.212030 type:complete len:755 (+) comp18583_c0_seq4:2147-4411(+)
MGRGKARDDDDEAWEMDGSESGLYQGSAYGSSGALGDDAGADRKRCCGSLCAKISEYPAAVPFIVGNEFCERFCFYGLRAVLVLYFKNQLQWTAERATVAYHAFVMAAYLTPLFGAALADSKFGKYRTIFWLSVVYVLGNVTLAVTAIPTLTGGDHPQWWGAALGLLLTAIGTGGIKPCVASFGGDQFDITQAHLLSGFFAMFYASINAGSLISTLLTPKLRGDVACFGSDECYPLAFGLPALLMVAALVLFFLGRTKYKRRVPERNVVVDVAKAVWIGAKHRLGRCFGSNAVKHDHWLDAAAKPLGTAFISDVKALGRVLYVFLPFPIYWTLYDQQGSRWTLQAAQMQTFSMGPLGEFHPDQMQALNSVLILLFIPLFQTGVYPLLKALRIPPSQLQRMGIGMLLCAVSFVVSGLVQLRIDASTTVPAGTATSGQVRLFNALPQSTVVTLGNDPSSQLTATLASGESTPFEPWAAGTVDVVANASTFGLNATALSVLANTAATVVVAAGTQTLWFPTFPIDFSSADDSKAHVRLIHADPAVGNVVVTSVDDDDLSLDVAPFAASEFSQGSLDGETHTIRVTEAMSGTVVAERKVQVRELAAYSLVLFPTESGDSQLGWTVDAPGSSVSILWQVPQYVLITCGEIFFSITGLEFAYSEAPHSMKAVVQAAWLLTTACGSLVVIIVAESSLFSKQSDEFFAYAGILGALVPVFTVMAWTFKYAHYDQMEEHAAADGDSRPLILSDSDSPEATSAV